MNQMCLSLAVQPTAMEIQSNLETAAGERLLLSVLRPPRGTFYFLEVSLSWHRNSQLCFIKESAYVVDNKAQIIWSWENSIRNSWAHTEIFRLQALMSWQISAQFETLLRFLLKLLSGQM